ncbi:MAG: hypothetical protein ACLVAS_00475 [Mediterraneibacter gnavus]
MEDRGNGKYIFTTILQTADGRKVEGGRIFLPVGRYGQKCPAVKIAGKEQACLFEKRLPGEQAEYLSVCSGAELPFGGPLGCKEKMKA